MPKSSISGDMLLRQYVLLSQKIAKFSQLLQDSACLNPEEREIIGYICAFEKISGDSESFKVFKEALEIIGNYRFPRTELTDLGFKIGNKDHISRNIEEEIKDLLKDE